MQGIPPPKLPSAMRPLLFALSIIPLCVATLSAEQGEELGLRVPPGFEVTRFADDDLAHDIYSLTFDARGRVVVAGEGHIKTLFDDDRDGKADRQAVFSLVPKSGAHGMCFDGDTLYATGDHSVLRLRDRDGDGRSDEAAEIVAAGLKHSEHGTNGIIRGPDGWWYLSLGNDAGASAKLATTPGSPVKEPKQGVVLRYSPDFQRSEIVADGFRNPYDLAFAEQGNILLVDADGERDQYMPWYSPNRLFDVATGTHHGWMIFGWQRSWNRPSYFCDNVERLVEIGRGSPTGSLVYRHTQFPLEYRGNFFSACWTLGKVYRFVLTRRDSTFESQKEVFLETTGATGFAPVDLAIGPEGAMYVAIGGRGTRGSVFRVRWKGGDDAAPPDPTTVVEALRYPQPLDAWSRARTGPILAKADPKELAAVAADSMHSAKTRMRAVEALVEHHGGLDGRTARRIIISAKHETPELVARVAWAVSRTAKDPDWTLVKSLATHPNLIVQRAALEALAASPLAGKALDPFRWKEVADSGDRRIRAAAQLAGVEGEIPVLRDFADEVTLPATLFARLRRGAVQPGDFAAAVEVAKTQKGYWQLDAIRYLQLALGDVNLAGTPEVTTGYTLPKNVRPTAEQRAKLEELAFISRRSDDNDRERVRLLAMAGIAEPDEYEHAPLTGASSVESDIHYLITLSLTPGERNDFVTHYTALALARLHHKMRTNRYVPSRFWPARVGEVVEALFKHDPKLPEELVKQDEFGLPVQSLFAEKMTGATQLAAIRKLVAAAAKDDDARWTPEFVKLVAKLPRAEALPILRTRWEEAGLREAILPVLVAEPSEEDRARLAEALDSSDAAAVVAAARALQELNPPLTAEELLAAVSALKRFTLDKQFRPTRDNLLDLLEFGTDQRFEIDESKARDISSAYEPWFAWFANTHPQLAKRLGGLDAAEWQGRVATIPWGAGDAGRGKLVFERRSCAKCHAGENRFGPDLAGAAGRFSNADLLAAIVDPNKDVAPTYKTVQVETASGKTFAGLVVYESPESTLLATGPDTSLRVTGEEIIAMRPSRLSLMPAGLLQGATDQEIADLTAYLKTLKGP